MVVYIIEAEYLRLANILFVAVWEVVFQLVSAVLVRIWQDSFSTLIERTEALSSNAAESVNLRFER